MAGVPRGAWPRPHARPPVGVVLSTVGTIDAVHRRLCTPLQISRRAPLEPERHDADEACRSGRAPSAGPRTRAGPSRSVPLRVRSAGWVQWPVRVGREEPPPKGCCRNPPNPGRFVPKSGPRRVPPCVDLAKFSRASNLGPSERISAMPRRVLIMGAAGRDFHNFNVVLPRRPPVEVVGVHRDADPVHRRPDVPAELAGDRTTRTASRSIDESSSTRADHDELESTTSVLRVLRRQHEYVMHAASEVLAAGANFAAPRPERDDAAGDRARRRRSARSGPGRARARRRARSRERAQGCRQARGRRPPPDAVRRPRARSGCSGSRRSRTSTR